MTAPKADPLAMLFRMRNGLHSYQEADAAIDQVLALAEAARSALVRIDTVTGGEGPPDAAPNWKAPLRQSSAELRAALAPFKATQT